MSQAQDLLKVYEGTYPSDVFFGGGYMPEEVDDDDPTDVKRKTKKDKKESAASTFLGQFGHLGERK